MSSLTSEEEQARNRLNSDVKRSKDLLKVYIHLQRLHFEKLQVEMENIKDVDQKTRIRERFYLNSLDTQLRKLFECVVEDMKSEDLVIQQKTFNELIVSFELQINSYFDDIREVFKEIYVKDKDFLVCWLKLI